ncbi:hypothetical protein ABW19_dt0203918 [Dactylella cylindrospora]|nr:hypothetical protein ABW19_dt0203918 [Dactylella cylindrospora]
MTANITDNSFNKSLEKFRKRLSYEQRQGFSYSNFDEVKLEIQRIQQKLGPEKKLRSFTRIKKFLEGMRQIEQLVQIFLNVHEVVAFVWGPIKVGLMVASTKVETLDKLLGAYEEIGEVLHGVDKYDKLFRNYPDIRRILEIYFYDVLEFHHEVLEVFVKPDEKLTAVLEGVNDTRDFMENTLQGLLTEIKAKLDDLKQTANGTHQQQQESLTKQRLSVKAKLGVLKHDADQRSALAQHYSPRSGTWVLDSPTFKSWLNGCTQPDSVLYLNGIPGSGKTTLVSRIIDSMQAQAQKGNLDGIVLFFYFKHATRGDGTRTRSDMLRSFLAQVVDQDDSMLEYMHQALAQISETEILTEEFLESHLKHSLGSQRKVWIIADGLDEQNETHEIEEMESRRTIEWFEEEILDTHSLRTSRIRLLISGQRDGHIDQMLSTYPGIDLDKVDSHNHEIREYSREKAALIEKRFKLGAQGEADIINRVVENSNGIALPPLTQSESRTKVTV